MAEIKKTEAAVKPVATIKTPVAAEVKTPEVKAPAKEEVKAEAKKADRCWAKGVLGSWQHSSHGGENFWDVSFLHDVSSDSSYVSIITNNCTR